MRRRFFSAKIVKFDKKSTEDEDSDISVTCPVCKTKIKELETENEKLREKLLDIKIKSPRHSTNVCQEIDNEVNTLTQEEESLLQAIKYKKERLEILKDKENTTDLEIKAIENSINEKSLRLNEVTEVMKSMDDNFQYTRKSIHEMETNQKDTDDYLVQLRTSINTIEEQIKDNEINIEEKTKDYNDIMELVSEKDKELEEKKNYIKDLDRVFDEMKIKNQQLKQDLKDIIESNETLERDIALKKQRLNNLNVEKSAIKNKINTIKFEITEEKSSLKSEVQCKNTIECLIVELQEHNSSLDKKISTVKEEKENLNEESDYLNDKIILLKDEIKNKTKIKKELEILVNETDKELDYIEHKLRGIAENQQNNINALIKDIKLNGELYKDALKTKQLLEKDNNKIENGIEIEDNLSGDNLVYVKSQNGDIIETFKLRTRSMYGSSSSNMNNNNNKFEITSSSDGDKIFSCDENANYQSKCSEILSCDENGNFLTSCTSDTVDSNNNEIKTRKYKNKSKKKKCFLI